MSTTLLLWTARTAKPIADNYVADLIIFTLAANWKPFDLMADCKNSVLWITRWWKLQKFPPKPVLNTDFPSTCLSKAFAVPNLPFTYESRSVCHLWEQLSIRIDLLIESVFCLCLRSLRWCVSLYYQYFSSCTRISQLIFWYKFLGHKGMPYRCNKRQFDTGFWLTSAFLRAITQRRKRV